MDGTVIDKRLAHRVGSPILPVLPVFSSEISGGVFLSKNIHGIAIEQILKDNGVNYHGIQQWIRKNQSGQGGRTLLIIADFQPNITSIWVQAVTAIRRYLISHGLGDFFVEITDFTEHQNEAIDKDSMVLCQQLLPSILANMGSHAWVTVDFLRCFSRLHGEMRPTVAISAVDADDERWWETTLPKIKEVIGDHFEMNLFCLKSIFTNYFFDPQKPNVLFKNKNYDSEVDIGASCGLGGSESTGTLGGRVTLQTEDGNQIHLGLTNFHVLLKGAPVPQGKATGPGQIPANLVAFSPSDKDHELFVTKLDRECNQTKKYLHQSQEREIALGRQPEDGDSDQFAFAKADVLRSSLNRRLADNPRRLGNIYAASGLTVGPNPNKSGDWILDWCLVQLDSDRTIDSTIPAVDDFVKIPEGARISKYQSIEATEIYEVVKYGRSSGWTSGNIAGLSAINPGHENLSPYSVQIEPGRSSIVDILTENLNAPTLKEHKHALCHSIVSSTKFKKNFLLPGDSGCLVLLNKDIQGAAVAVGLGFAENEATGVAYMIPIDTVFQQIESVCDAHIVEPSLL